MKVNMTEENIKRMAKEAGFSDGEVDYIQSIIIHFATLVAQQEREACAKLCDLAMLQNQEAINELEEDEHIAQCFIQGAMTQLVKTSKAIRARGQA